MAEPTNTAPTFSIAYGFCEGSRIGQSLYRALQKSGLNPTQNLKQANIIITHSGGYVHVPANHQAQLIVHIGVPYHPGVSQAGSIIQKVRQDLRADKAERRWLAHKTWWNMIYAWNISANIRMHRDASLSLLQRGHQQTVFIRNRDDPICSGKIHSLDITKQVALISLPGQHDDCWIHPEAYVAIVQSIYGSTVLA